jgi:hypothetical protein
MADAPSASNHLKTPLFLSLNKFASKKIAAAMAANGMQLPCSVVSVQGSIVTVGFDVQTDATLPQITIPVFGSEYIRLPIQPGCKGVTLAMDVRLGALSGLGGAAPKLGDKPGNLSALVFMPVGNKNWFAVNGANLVLYAGPNCLLQITPTGVTVTGSAGKLSTAQALEAGNGATGTFTSQDGKTITVTKGIVTNIV